MPNTLTMAISPDGQHLYVGPNVFERDATTGNLTFLEKSSNLGAHIHMIISSDNRHVYMSSANSSIGLGHFFRAAVSLPPAPPDSESVYLPVIIK